MRDRAMDRDLLSCPRWIMDRGNYITLYTKMHFLIFYILNFFNMPSPNECLVKIGSRGKFFFLFHFTYNYAKLRCFGLFPELSEIFDKIEKQHSLSLSLSLSFSLSLSLVTWDEKHWIKNMRRDIKRIIYKFTANIWTYRLGVRENDEWNFYSTVIQW